MAGLSRPETKNDEHSPESNGSSMRSGAISSRNYIKKLIKKKALSLVEAFPDVSASASDGHASELSEFKIDAHDEPSIFGAVGGGSAREELAFFPATNPALQMPQPDDTIKPIEFRKDGQSLGAP